MKRLALAMGIVLVLLVGPGSAAAADGGADIQIVTVSFAPLNSGTCQYLSAGPSITWTGPLTSITRTRTDASGITTVSNMSHANGVATDGVNQYVFNYSNSFRVSNTIGALGTFTGTMTDSFSLAGQGPARLHNGFDSGVTLTNNFTSFAFDSVHSRGDPIDFVTGASHCDPL